jgi:N-acetyl-anhydromuramyl-L-alanine amidase AmpD
MVIYFYTLFTKYGSEVSEVGYLTAEEAEAEGIAALKEALTDRGYDIEAINDLDELNEMHDEYHVKFDCFTVKG